MELPSNESSDIFSITDQVLSERLQFIEEIGFGNWGSVWLCRPKTDPTSPSNDNIVKTTSSKIAVKLVHRSKTPTTAARVRSLWNEMKIVKTFKDDSHPSIVPFYSFVITPSYALITMAYLPTLIPVEVEESKAKPWFRSLLSAVSFLHERGIVHNDIKPANVLLSPEHVPVLVDFGFAEKYTLNAPDAFHSNLAYGTPEYLSPERARGLPHDTRKSDVWSLGITFFEILVGRTPFEIEEGEQFSSKEDLERYWARTMRGKWVGEWKISREAEKLLKRMILPNADLRCLASTALLDPYWGVLPSTLSASSLHKRSASAVLLPTRKPSSTKLRDIVAPKPREPLAPSSMRPNKVQKENNSPAADKHTLGHSRSKSYSQAAPAHSKKEGQSNKKRMIPSILANLTPIKGSPAAEHRKENANASAASSRSRKAAVTPPAANPLSPRGAENLRLPVDTHGVRPPKRAVLTDLTKNMRNIDKSATQSNTSLKKGNGSPTKVSEVKKMNASTSSSVRDRFRDWEREKERLREMTRLEDLERDRDEAEIDAVPERRDDTASINEPIIVMAPAAAPKPQPPPPSTPEISDLPSLVTHSTSYGMLQGRSVSSFNGSNLLFGIAQPPLAESTLPHTTLPDLSNDSGFNFKRSMKLSMDKVRNYKASVGHLISRAAGKTSISAEAELDLSAELEDDLEKEAVKEKERVDRLTTWVRDVERVVEEARESFAVSAAIAGGRVPEPLPAPTSSRSSSVNKLHNHSSSSRLPPRKVLAASQIFTDESMRLYGSGSNDAGATIGATVSSKRSILSLRKKSRASLLDKGADSADKSASVTKKDSKISLRPLKSKASLPFLLSTPARRRRATIAVRSPEMSKGEAADVFDIDTGSPSKRKEKSKSQGNLYGRIVSPDKLEQELAKQSKPAPSPRLSAVVSPNVFIAPPGTPLPEMEELDANISKSFDDPNSSMLQIEPYPTRQVLVPSPALLDESTQRHTEAVYDRFLMATAGVKRNGKGYCSDHVPPLQSNAENINGYNGGVKPNHPRTRRSMTFGRPGTAMSMRPPVGFTKGRTASCDELGMMLSTPTTTSGTGNKEPAKQGTFVRRALKAVTGGMRRTVLA